MVNGRHEGLPASRSTRVPALLVAPRVGFAYALSGDGRTALRGGAGIFYDRVQGNPTMNMAANPPTSFSPTLYYSTFADLVASANSALLAPSTISHSLYGKGTMPQNYQYTLGDPAAWWAMRRSLEVAYVGNFSRHLLWERNINPVPVGAQFLNLHPENRDPTTNAAYANNFLRPYIGYGDILEYEFGATSSYNSLQAGILTRRMKAGLQMRSFVHLQQGAGFRQQRHRDGEPVLRPARLELRPSAVQPYPCLHHVAELQRCRAPGCLPTRLVNDRDRTTGVCTPRCRSLPASHTVPASARWTGRTSRGRRARARP